jgi:hypothetical protein
METIVPTQTEKTPHYDELLVACLILKEVNQTVRNIHMLVTGLLRCVAISASIANGLMGMVMPGVTEDH